MDKKYYKKTSVTKQALCFDYTELMANYNINLNIDMGMPDEGSGRDTLGTGAAQQAISVIAGDHAYSNGFAGTLAVGPLRPGGQDRG